MPTDLDTLEARARRLVELAAEIRDGMPYTNDERDAVYYGAVFANAYLDTLAALEEARGLLEESQAVLLDGNDPSWGEEVDALVVALGDFLARHPSPKETP